MELHHSREAAPHLADVAAAGATASATPPAPPAAMAPPLLQFSDLTFTVPTKNGTKELLRGVCGYCSPGRVTAIVGPSGSGKTTLLDVLAGGHYGGSVSGSVTVDGEPLESWAAANTVGIVTQHDVLPKWDTAREALTTSALLLLPPAIPGEQKLRTVDEVLSLLDLDQCADLVIGDSSDGLRGLSGGQRRRVSIGIELVKSPRLIFCDEPLSGLDSETGGQVAECLSQLAASGRTVVMSLHPDGRQRQYADHLILLSSGTLVYCGEFGDTPTFLQSLGHSRQHEQTWSELMLFVLKDENLAGQAAAAFAEQNPRGAQPLKDADLEQDMLSEDLERIEMAAVKARKPLKRANGAVAPLWEQLLALTRRNMRWLRRDIASTIALLSTVLLSGIMMGILFWGTGIRGNQDVIDRNILAVLWLLTTLSVFFYSNQSISDFNSARRLVRHEHNTRMYGILTWFLAFCIKWALLLPMFVLLFTVVSYFSIRLKLDASTFFLYVATQTLSTYTTFMMALCVASVMPSAASALAIMSSVALLLMASSGFLTASVPIFLVWVQKSSYITFVYNSLVLGQLGKGVVAPLGSIVVYASWGVAGCMAMVAAICGGFFILAGLLLWLMARAKKL